MNKFLMSLLGQQVGPEVVDEIVVPGTRPGTPASAMNGPSAEEVDRYAGMQLDNTEAIRQRDRALEAGAKEANHKGAFGMKGTLRDIVGILGDAFLVQSGNEAVYQPQREKERLGDAMAGSSIDPIGARERAMGVDPAFATEYGLKTEENTNAANRVRAQGLEGDRKNFNDASGMVSQMYAAAITTGTPEALAQAEQGARIISQRTGIPLEQLLAGGDPALIAGRGMTGYQNFRIPQYERGLDQGDRRLDIALRGAKDREARTKILQDALGFKKGSKIFDMIMDEWEFNQRTEEEQGRNRRAGVDSSAPASEGTPAKTWTIKPAGK